MLVVRDTDDFGQQEITTVEINLADWAMGEEKVVVLW